MFNGNVAVCVEIIADHSAALLPEEKKIVETVVQKRREEFSTGRLCAHTAMQAINPNHQTEPLLPGEKREPLWPNNLIGSISHSADSCLAVVTSDSSIRSLGVDIEKREGINPGVRDLICSAEELNLLGDYADSPEAWKLIFSAKESIYKALFPLIKKWIGFSDAQVCFNFETQEFVATVSDNVALPNDIDYSVNGRYHISDGYILTVVEIPRS